ncbi:hypothetical protein BJX64DRAFT_270563 [Aspergillus heterothallicus]
METTKPYEGEVLHSLFARQVIRLGDKVVKSGPNLRAHEVYNLIHRCKHDDPCPHRCINRDGIYMPGEPLDRVWDGLTADAKLSVAMKLPGYVS